MVRTKQTARKGTLGTANSTMKAGGPGIAQKAPWKPPMNPPTKKKRRWRPGTVALREIQWYQKGTELLIRKIQFQRLVYEILRQNNNELLIQASVMMGQQEVCEAYLVGLFEDTNLCAIRATVPKTKLGPLQDHPSIPRGDILEKLPDDPLGSNCYSYTWLDGPTLNGNGRTLETSRYNTSGSLICTSG